MAYFCPLSRVQEKCIFTPTVLMLNKQRQQASFQTIKSILLQDVEFLKQDTKKKLTLSLPLTLVPCHVVVGVSYIEEQNGLLSERTQ